MPSKKRRNHAKKADKARELFQASQHASLASNQDAIDALGPVQSEGTSTLDALANTYVVGGGLYAKGRTLGEGGEGAVHQWDSHDDQHLAVKTAKEGHEDSLVHEAGMLAAVGGHDNILGLEDEFLLDDELHVATEFLGGGDMDEMNARLTEALQTGKIGYGEYIGAMQYMHKQVLQGVAHLEDNNVSHGDLKPDNVAFDDDMVPKIIDFGTARNYGEEKARAGNAGYAGAPEALRSAYRVDRGRDVHAVGQMVHEGVEGSVSDSGGGVNGLLVARGTRRNDKGSAISVDPHGAEFGEGIDGGQAGRKAGSFGVHTALTDFLDGTTQNRVDDRFTAQRALDSQFLQDPLLQEEQAQDLLKRLSGKGPQTTPEDIELAELGLDDDAHDAKSAMQYQLLQATRGRRKSLDKDASKRSKAVKKATRR